MKIIQVGNEKFVIFLDQKEFDQLEIPARLEVEKILYDSGWFHDDSDDWEEEYDDQ